MGGGGDLNRLPPLENTALGVTAGTIEVAMLQPMLYCKNATQQGLPFTLNPAVLYRGIGMSVINMSVLTGLQFPLTGAVATAITGGANRDMSSAEKISAGFAGGALSGIVCAPMELVMIQQQRFGANLSSAASRVVQEFGAGSLFRGLTMSMGREGLFTAGYLGLGPVFAGKLKEANALGGSQGACDFAGAVGAGMIAATLSHPMDTIKTVPPPPPIPFPALPRPHSAAVDTSASASY